MNRYRESVMHWSFARNCLEDEREYFLKKNMEERKNYQGECIALAKMAAYLPMFLLIILKLVVPFVAEGLSELHAYSQSMTGFF